MYVMYIFYCTQWITEVVSPTKTAKNQIIAHKVVVGPAREMLNEVPIRTSANTTKRSIICMAPR